MAKAKVTPGEWFYDHDSIYTDLPEGMECGEIVCLSPLYGRFEESQKQWKSNRVLLANARRMFELLKDIKSDPGDLSMSWIRNVDDLVEAIENGIK